MGGRWGFGGLAAVDQIVAAFIGIRVIVSIAAVDCAFVVVVVAVVVVCDFQTVVYRIFAHKWDKHESIRRMPPRPILHGIMDAIIIVYVIAVMQVIFPLGKVAVAASHELIQVIIFNIVKDFTDFAGENRFSLGS